MIQPDRWPVIRHALVPIALLAGISAQAIDNFGTSDLMSLSLEDLMDIRVSTGSLSDSTSATSSSAITIIRQEQIELSAAKNLAVLLEQHVPGLMLMEHSEGNKIGIRGLIAAENYKLLLLLNGKNITNMVYEGAITELDLWDLGDIERVEVVRGPGSVTYGTGAIAGVINIITKSANSNTPKTSISLMDNRTYGSSGVNFQYRSKFDDIGIYSFLSYRKTDGDTSPKYFQMTTGESSDIRYLGYRGIDTEGPQPYLADTQGRPQIKAHLNLSRHDNLDIWMRYTQSGQTHNFGVLKELSNGTAVNSNQLSLRSFATSVDHSYSIDDASALNSSFLYSNQEYIRYRLRNPDYAEDSIHNIRQYAFSQERILGTLTYSFKYEDKLDLIIGYEYSQINVNAPWGESDDHIWIYEGTDLISSNTDSVYIDDSDPSLVEEADPNDSIEIGSGLSFQTHTQLLEGTYKLNSNMELLYAHRIDFSDVSDTMYSPRLSLTNHHNEHNISVITAQRALRMMPLRAQYIADLNNDSSDHETIDSIEASITNTGFHNTSLNLRAYYNKIKAVGFTGDRLEFLSDMELAGLELEGRYKADQFEFSVNHAYLDLISMNMNDELKDGNSRNNISFADYYYNTSDRNGSAIPILLTSYGNGLNNWSTNSTKLLFTYNMLDNRLKSHLNVQIYWDYDGAYDEMHMYQQAYDNFDTNSLSAADLVIFNQQKADFENERALLEAEDAYEYDFALNGSMSYEWQKDKDYELSISVFIENILNTKKRYYVSTGSSDPFPARLKFLEEPRTIGVNLNLNFQ